MLNFVGVMNLTPYGNTCGNKKIFRIYYGTLNQIVLGLFAKEFNDFN
jgi:hypothetical protein